eukprot:13275.XXX_874835_874999_1 [CDS] Oithona nana genome sequencing.
MYTNNHQDIILYTFCLEAALVNHNHFLFQNLGHMLLLSSYSAPWIDLFIVSCLY